MKAGSIIAGKYELVALLGEGGMGSVWRARRAGWPSDVAVKVIHAILAQDESAVERFRREARMAAEMRGPNVVQVLDDGVDDASKSPFLVMELLAGETLAARLERCVRLTPRDTLHIVRQLESVLTSAHDKQVVHRDLKPENVFLTGPADAPIVKVLDFGVAKWGAESVRVNARTATGSVLGTPFYMSPEQLRDSSRVDYRCDVWSLGVMVFECLTGRRPFDGESLVELAIQICQGPRPVASSVAPVPAGFDAWFARSAAVDPEQRFQSAAELSDTLSRVCAAKALVGAFGSESDDETLASPGAAAAPAGAPSIGPLSSTRPAAHRSRGVKRWPLAVASFALLLGSLSLIAWQGGFFSAREDARSAAPLPELTAAQPTGGVTSAAAPSSPPPSKREEPRPGTAERSAEGPPVVSVLSATPGPPAKALPASTIVPTEGAAAAAPDAVLSAAPSSSQPALATSNLAKGAGLGSPTPAVLAPPAASPPAPAFTAPAPGPGSKPKPGWDTSFERTQPTAPRWDPSFDRR